MAKTFPEAINAPKAIAQYIKAIGKGLLKVMSKMGISTYQSYCGAQIFDAVGLAETFVQQYFTGTASKHRRRRPSRDRPRRARRATATRSAIHRSTSRRSTWAATTSIACAAKAHSWTL